MDSAGYGVEVPKVPSSQAIVLRGGHANTGRSGVGAWPGPPDPLPSRRRQYFSARAPALAPGERLDERGRGPGLGEEGSLAVGAGPLVIESAQQPGDVLGFAAVAQCGVDVIEEAEPQAARVALRPVTGSIPAPACPCRAAAARAASTQGAAPLAPAYPGQGGWRPGRGSARPAAPQCRRPGTRRRRRRAATRRVPPQPRQDLDAEIAGGNPHMHVAAAGARTGHQRTVAARQLPVPRGVNVVVEQEPHYPAAASSRDASLTSAALRSGNASKIASVS
jgi:hypothetical protein